MLHIKTTICASIDYIHLTLHNLCCKDIPIPKDSLAVFTNYPSVTKGQALKETVLTLFHTVVHGCFQLVGVKIVAHHDVVKG